MTRNEIEVFMEDAGVENLLLADGFDDAFIGYDLAKSRAVYDSDKCVQLLVAGGMSSDDAVEFFDFNVLGAYVGEKTPLFVRTVS